VSTRPKLDLKVGDDALIAETRRTERNLIPVKVTKISRVYLTVTRSDGERYLSSTQFNKETGALRNNSGYPSNTWLTTPEREKYDAMMTKARESIKKRGFAMSTWTGPTDGEIIAVARALRLLDDQLKQDNE
jgi:hypothetical protein